MSNALKAALVLGLLSLAACGGGGGGGAPTASPEPLADLRVTNVTGLPRQWNATESLTVSVTVRNQGEGNAGIFRVGLYASVDPNITTEDELIGSSSTNDILEGGDFSVVTITVPPSSVPSGLVPQAVEDLDRRNYYLGAIADIEGDVDEADEGNNDDHARNNPPAVRFDPSPLTIGGVLTGAITEGAASTSDTVTATDGDGGVDTFKTEVSPNSGRGTYGTLTITTAGVWTYTLDNSAGGATDRLDGTEDPKETDDFTIMAADRTEETVTITITGVDDLSTLSGGFEGSVTEDSTTNATATGEITVADVDTTPLPTITAQTTTGTYGNFTLSKKTPSDEADRVYSWTYTLDNTDEDTNALAAGATVMDEFTITTSDSRVNAEVTITITGADDSSTIGGDLSGSVTEDDSTNLTAEGTATVTDRDSEATFTAQTDTAGRYGTFSITTAGVWTYNLDNSPGDTRGDATNALEAGQTESETFPITTSGENPVSVDVTITVNGANDAATFSGTQTGAVTEDATVNTATGTITVSDVDGANALKQQADQTGSYGSLSVNHSTGTWTYTLTNSGDNAQARATQALAGGETATETFTILAADDTPTTLTITITGVNDEAVFGTTGLTGAITEGTASTTGTVTSTDVDGDNNVFKTEVSPNDSTTLTTGTGTYGTLTITSAGAWTYTLDNSAGGATDLLAGGATAPDAFTIMAADGTSETVTITITGVDDLSTLSGGFEGSVTEDNTTNSTATGEITVADVDTTPIPTITAQTNKAGTYGSFTIGKKTPSDEADRVYSWTYTLDNADEDTNALAAGTIVEDEFTITTSDGVNAKVTITITGADDSSTIGGDLSGSVTEDDSANLTAEGTATVTDEDSEATFVAQTGTDGRYGTFSITTAGDWTYSLDNSPGDSLGNATNALKAGQTESETFPITTSDRNSVSVTITVNGANDAAVFGTTGLTGSISEDADPNTVTGTAQATDVDGDDNKFTAVTAPASVSGTYGSLTITEDGAWTYSLDNSNAMVNALGQDAPLTDSLTIQTADGTEGTITITITGVNDKSSIDVTGSEGAVTEDDTANATVTGTFTLTDPDTSPLPTITEETQTGTYGQLAIAVKTRGTNDGEYTWTYTLDNDDSDTNALTAGSTATETFTIAASDNGEAMVTISITGANDPATFSGPATRSGAVTEDATDNTDTGTITVSDVDGDNALKEQADQTGIYGSLSVDHSAGTWTYTLTNSGDNARARATQALAGGETANETFTLLAADDTETMVTITITGVNDAATIGGTVTGAISEDADPNTVKGTAQATDVDGDDNKFTAVTAPASVSGSYGSLTITEDGAWTYSLDNSNAMVNALGQDAPLTDSLTIQTADGTEGTITITITGVNDKSSIDVTGSGRSITEDDTANTTVTGAFTLTDPDTSPLPTITEETKAGTYGRLAIAMKTSGTNDGEYTWTYTLDNDDSDTNALTAGAAATETFTIAASDNGEAMVTISITGANDPATFSGPATRSGAVTEDATDNTATGTITVSDVDGDNALKEQADQTGIYGSLSVNHSTGAWTYTLTNSGDNAQARATQALAGGETANETFTLLAADDTETMVTITITGVDDLSTLSGGFAGSVTEDSTTNATATGEITVADVDSTPLPTITAQTTTGTYGSFTIGKKNPSDEADRVYRWTYTLDNMDEDTNTLAAGATVEDEFTITTSDGVNAKVTITITGANDNSTIGGALTGEVTEDDSSKNEVTGTATITDVDTTPTPTFTAQTDQTGTYGTFSLRASGEWIYTLDNTLAATQGLDAGDSETDSFTIAATDGTTATVVITVTGAAETSTIGGTLTGAVKEDVDAEAKATGTATYTGTDPFRTQSGQKYTYGLFSIDANGDWRYALNNNDSDTNALVQDEVATETITITATDGTTATVTITITGANDIIGERTGSITKGTATTTGTASVQGGSSYTFAQTDAAGRYGRFSIEASGAWTYTLDGSDPDTQALRAQDTENEVPFTIMATFDATTVTADVIIMVTGSGRGLRLTPMDGSLVADWTAAASAPGGYQVSWRTVEPKGELTSQNVSAGTLTDTITGLTNGTRYFVRVDPLDTNGKTISGNTVEAEATPRAAAVATISGDLLGAVTEDAVKADNRPDNEAMGVANISGGATAFKTEVTPTTGRYGSLAITSAGAWTYTLDNEDSDTDALTAEATVTDTFTIMAADGTSATITITITGANDAAQFSGTRTGAVTEDATGNTATGTITVTDVDGNNALKQQADQTGTYGSLNVDHTTGTWTYTLDNSAGGATDLLDGTEDPKKTDAFTIMAADGTEETITITITGVNDAATFSGTQTGAVTEDATVNTATGNITVTDVDGDNALKQQADQTGTYGSFSVDHSTGAWTYTLTNRGDNAQARATQALAGEATATETFTLLAADDTSTTVTITITGVNDAATFSGTRTGAVMEDAMKANNTPNNEVMGDVAATDVDGTDDSFKTEVSPNDGSTLTTGTGKYGSLTLTSAGVWTYTLNNSDPDTAALRDGQSVTDIFTIMAEDGTPTTVTITVSGADDESSIGGELAGAVTEDAMETTASGTVTVTDSVTITAKTETSAYGTFTLSAEGNWNYSLDNSFAATNALASGATGDDPFTIAASDGSSATVIITITGANDAAVFDTPTLTGAITEDAVPNRATGTAQATDVDGEDNKFTAVGPSNPTAGTYGSLTISEDGYWTYTLNNNLNAVQELPAGGTLQDSLAIQAEDGTAGTITITIRGANDAAIIGGAVTGAIIEGADSITGTVTSSDVDGTDNAFKTEVSPTTGSYGSLTLTEVGVWTYRLDNADGGATDLLDGTENPKPTDEFTIMAADGTEETITITITGINDDATIVGDTTGALTRGTPSTAGTVRVQGGSGYTFARIRAAGRYGTFNIGANGAWYYTLNDSDPDTQALRAQDTENEVPFTIMATFDATTVTADIIIMVTGSGRGLRLTPMDGSLVADWTAAASAPGGYLVRWRTVTPKGELTSQSVSAGTLTDTITGLTNGTRYFVRVDPLNADETVNRGNTLKGEATPRAVAVATISGDLLGAVTEDAVKADNRPDNEAMGVANVSGGATAFKTEVTPTTGRYGSLAITSAGDWTYTLDNEDSDTNALTAGATVTDTFTIMATDGTSATITITITGANDAAQFSGTRTGAVTEDATGNTATGTITVTDVDGNNALKQQADQTGTYGSLNVDHTTGTWTYTLDNSDPDTAALRDGQSVTDAFTIMAEDGTPTTVTITVSGADDASSITGDLAGAVTEDDSTNNMASGTVTVTGGGTFTAKTETSDYGTFTLGATGTWTYSLDNSFPATNALAGGATVADPFTIAASDGSSATVIITITGAKDGAIIGGTLTGSVITRDGSNFRASGFATFVGANFQTQSGQKYTYGVFGIDADGAWRYNLDNNDPDTRALAVGGTETITITVANEANTQASVIITINPNPGLIGSVTEDVRALQTASGQVPTEEGTSYEPQFNQEYTYGRFSIAVDGSWFYRLNNNDADTNALSQGEQVTESITVTAMDGSTVIITITITGSNDSATITGSNGGLLTEGQPTATFSGRAYATDPDNPDNTFDIRHIVLGGTVDGDNNFVGAEALDDMGEPIAPTAPAGRYGSFQIEADGSWTYTINNDDPDTNALGIRRFGSDFFAIRTIDGSRRTLTFRIIGVNDPADITGTLEGSVTEDATENAFTGSLTVTDVDGDDALKQQADQTGSYGRLSVDHSAGNWTYTLTNSGDNDQARATQALAEGATATETFTILAADDTSTTVTITVTGANDEATIGGAVTGAITEDADPNSIQGVVTATDVDAGEDGFKTEVSPTTGSYGSLTLTTAGIWIYTLNNEGEDTNALTAGSTVTDTFTIMAADGTTATVTITVTGSNDPAQFGTTGLTGVITEDANPNTVTGDVAATDVDGTDDRFKTEVSPNNGSTLTTGTGRYGSLTLTSAGVWTYTLDNGDPNTAALRAGQSVIDAFTIMAEDGTEATVTITVNGADDPSSIGGNLAGAVTENDDHKQQG